MNKLFYMGLEPYEGRYTLQLQEWSERVFKQRGIDYTVVPGTTIDNTKLVWDKYWTHTDAVTLV